MATPNGADFLLKVRQRSTMAAAVAGGGNVGNGTVTQVTGRSAGITETITLTNVVAGGAGVAVFRVSGSVSGIIGYVLDGVLFRSDIVGLLVTAGGTPWALNDSFTIAATIGTFVTVAAVSRYSKKGDTDEQNFPTFGGVKFVVPGTRNVGYTASGYLDTTDVGQQTLRDHEALKAKVVIQVLFDGVNGFQHEARPRSFTHEADAEGGLQPITFEFAGDSANVTTMVGTGPTW